MLKDSVTPLRELDISGLLPPLSSLESAYHKLRSACNIYGDDLVFYSKVNKWLTMINTTLRIIHMVTRIIEEVETFVC